MTRLLVAFASVAISIAALSAIPPVDDVVRVFADSTAKAMTEKNDSILYDNMAPAMIEAYGKEKLVAPLQQIRARYGDIVTYELKQATVGTTLAGTRELRTATFWYALKTTKFKSGCFLQISVTKEANRFYLAGYKVTEFVGNEIPPELQGTRSPHAQQMLAGAALSEQHATEAGVYIFGRGEIHA